MASQTWQREVAEAYDATTTVMSDPAVVGPTVDRLVELAGGGRALEFASGTGRIALPLSERGIDVSGIELSPHMTEQLAAKPGAERVAVTLGDMTTTRVPGTFSLVYLVFNTIMNVTTLDDQIAVFTNAAAHLVPGGCFVVEVCIPNLRLLPPGELGRVFTLESDHVGLETFDDMVGQISWSHHWMEVNGQTVRHSAPYRYVWPAELELMGRLTGFTLRERWASWDGRPLRPDSSQQIAVFEKSA